MTRSNDFSKQRSDLSQTKQALLQRWERGEFSIVPDVQTIPRYQPHGPVPLSFAQQRLWFIDQLVPGNSAYNISLIIWLTGSLNVAALQESLNEIVRRHEVLHTIFPTTDGKPAQVTVPTSLLSLPLIDLSRLLEAERVSTVQQLASKEVQQPFDLACGPLVRTRLLRLNANTHVFHLVIHHTICDGWSLKVFMQELVALYKAFSDGKPSPLPELPIQYANFAIWQREMLQGEMLKSQLIYWKKQLADAPPVLQLPTNRPRPPVQTFHGAHYAFSLPQPLAVALRKLSQQEGVTLFMTLLAAFQALLSRYTRQDDIIVGTPIANRQQVETEKLIGFFASTLVLRTDISGNPSFRELLGRVREVTLGAYSHQDLPFEQLVEELQIKRDMSRNPLFQVMFNFRNAPRQEVELPGLTMSFTTVDSGRAMLDLWLSMVHGKEGLKAILEYNSDIFEETTISRMMRHFQTLLESVVTNSAQHLSELPLLTMAERHQLQIEWNATRTNYPQDVCLHQLFEAQVQRTPEAVAIVFEGQQLTYHDLNQRANQLAHHLQATLEVGPDILVGICMERSLELVIGLLGIIKAGGAYIPLDPMYPKERLAFMLTDTQMPVLLVQQHLRERLPTHGTRTVCIDADWEYISHASKVNPISNSRPENLAYVIYTSGSTGRPKGAMNSHKGICNRLLWMQEAYHLTEADRVLQKTPFSFDVSVWEFFWPLLSGASLLLAQPEGHRDSVYLSKLIAEQQITTLHFVPSMLRVFLEERGLEQYSCLRRVICSGEALSLECLGRYFARLNADLYNLYGPTEAAVDVTHWSCERLSSRQTVPIGRPISNTQIYLLDQQLTLVPVGVPGELHIGGVGLARGYLNRPELTSEKFIPNLFSDQPGTRLYKTGDLARYLSDGTIEFIGRIDDQVKLRGYRIELGEIEGTLRRHPTVRDAIVLLPEDAHGDRHLAAYVVSHLPDPISEDLPAKTQILAKQVQHWQRVFDETYSEPSPDQESVFNLAGWNSSYTGLPIPTREMDEWLEHTVTRILNLHPKNALEIGCGTGLLLFRIAPYCTSYSSTDFSQAALNYLRQQLGRLKPQLPQITLLQRRANDFTDMQAETFDTVILNSVIQYFPNSEYLLQVLEGAVHVVKPGGFIFVGDVRNLPLLEAFHTSVELHRASPSMLTIHLQQSVHRHMAQENELVVDPAFFFALKQRFREISHVEVQLKRGHHHNELTRFRYDVILHLGSEVQPIVHFPWLDWQKQELTLPDVRQLLIETKPEILGVARVPNARLQTEIRTKQILAYQDECPMTVGKLQEALQECIPEVGVDPEDIWLLSDDLSYITNICWSSPDTVDGSYDVIFRRRTSMSAELYTGTYTSLAREDNNQRIWNAYTNDPLQNQLARQQVSDLSHYLKGQLPEYMVPSITLLDTLPLMPNGKVDRRILPEPDKARSLSQEAFTAPRTSVEETLAEIWAQVLGLEQVGINNNFFELGGDSIQSIQIVSRASQAGLHLTPTLLFQRQTVAELAAVIDVVSVTYREQNAVTDTFSAYYQSPAAERYTPSDFSLPQIDRKKLDQLLGTNQQIEDMYPLTPMQQSMLFQRCYTQNPELYWLCNRIVMHKAQINMSAFEQAWQQLVAQHPIMRTSFIWNDLAEPLQIVHKQASLSIEQHDWRRMSSTDQEEHLETYIQVMRLHGCDLSKAPQTRLTLFRMTDNNYLLFLGFNYMLQDGWSSTLLIRDCNAFYGAFCQGQELSLERPRHYRDYITWLQQQNLAKAEAFWCKTLKVITTPMPLTGRVLREGPRSGEDFVKEVLPLSLAMTTALRSMARKQQLTMGTLLHSAWALVLSHYSGQGDVLFGSLCSGRPATLAGSEYMVGFFNNILPLQVQVHPEARLLSWLQDLQVQMVEQREYEYTPMMMIKEWIGLHETLPMFESYVVFENFPTYSYETMGKKARQDFGTQSTDYRRFFVPTEYPLRVEFWSSQPLIMTISGYKRYCDAVTMARLLKYIKIVLEGMVTNPTQRVGDLIRLIVTEQ